MICDITNQTNLRLAHYELFYNAPKCEEKISVQNPWDTIQTVQFHRKPYLTICHAGN